MDPWILPKNGWSSKSKARSDTYLVSPGRCIECHFQFFQLGFHRFTGQTVPYWTSLLFRAKKPSCSMARLTVSMSCTPATITSTSSQFSRFSALVRSPSKRSPGHRSPPCACTRWRPMPPMSQLAFRVPTRLQPIHSLRCPSFLPIVTVPSPLSTCSLWCLLRGSSRAPISY